MDDPRYRQLLVQALQGDPPEPAPLFGDKNSGAQRDSLVKALGMLPANLGHMLHHEPMEQPGYAPSAGPSHLGNVLLSLYAKLHGGK